MNLKTNIISIFLLISSNFCLASFNKNPKDKRVNTPLMCTALSGKTDVVNSLHTMDVDPITDDKQIVNTLKNQKNYLHLLPMDIFQHMKSLLDPCDLIEVFYQLSLSSNKLNKNCKTFAHKQIKEMLLKGTKKEHTYLFFFAVQNNFSKLLIRLKEKKLDGQTVNKVDKDGNTFLMNAIRNNQIETAQALLSYKNIDLERANNIGYTSLMYAAEAGHTDIVRMLLEKYNFYHLNNRNNAGLNALQLAQKNGHTETANWLKINFFERIPQQTLIDIFFATYEKSRELIPTLYLLKMTSRVMKEKFENLLEKLKPLENDFIHYKANKSDSRGNTPLIIACKKGHRETVKKFLDHRVNPNKNNKDGLTPLMIASKYNHPEIVRILLEHKAHPNKPSRFGTTPLMIACEMGHPEIVRMLLAHRANPNQKNHKGKNALQIALKNNQKEIVKLFRKFMDFEINIF